MSGWQPVDTAPLNTRVLIWDGSFHYIAKNIQSGGYWIAEVPDGHYRVFSASHWMPLPTPPDRVG